MRQPRAYSIEAPALDDDLFLTEEPAPVVAAVEAASRRRFPLGAILSSALGALFALGAGLATARLVDDLFARASWLGWVAAGLAGLALAAFLSLLIREGAGLMREKQIEALRARAVSALANRHHAQAKAVGEALALLYRAKPETARGRALLDMTDHEILDAEDRLILVERELLAPLDLQAKRAIANAAKQVSVVTALSPRALIDVAFVIFAAFRLLRVLSRIYGGRPGMLGFWRVARAAVTTLAVTGGLAAGDSLVQQTLGHGIASRISAKLGEGVLNGFMTARFGIAALLVCRPLPFIGEKPPKLVDVAGELMN